MKKLLSLTICLLFSCAFAQDRGFRSEGREFYLGYIHPSFNDFADPDVTQFFKVYALVSSFEDNEVGVSYFDPQTKKEGYPTVYKLKARQTTYIPLEYKEVMQMKHPGDIAGEFKSCHLVSRRPVSVQYFSTGANAGGSYLALPVHAWGKEHVVASYEDGTGYGPVLDRASGVFLIIAAYDATNVTIIPRTRTAGGHVGVNQGAGATGKPQPYTIGLNRGQCWFVKSTATEGYDISGSIVKSDKPVAVISGHENASPGSGNAKGTSLDTRDFMIEQMVPVEFWDTTGYISIPFIDSPGGEEMPGDNFRFFISDKSTSSKLHIDNSEWSVFPYNPIEYSWIETPRHYFADSGKFMVMQYDLRNHGIAPPYTAPSMMTIVPRSSWRTAYQFNVPPNIDESLHRCYVTIIAPKDGAEINGVKRNWFSDSLLVTDVHGTLRNITHVGTQKRGWNSLPGSGDLRAITYEVSSGRSYYMRASFPFMAYHFGYRGVDPVDTLGNFIDEHYFSYSLPLGMSLSDKLTSSRMSLTIDTLCSGWRICATDSNQGGGIRYVTLIDDEDRDLWPEASRKFSNSMIDPSLDVHGHGECVLDGSRPQFCFNVEAPNPAKPSYAPIAIFDKAGNSTIVELRMPAKNVLLIPDADTGLKFSSSIGQDLCKEFTFINLPANPQSYTITKVDLPQPSPYKAISVFPSLPAIIAPGDTFRVNVCFNAPDSMLYRDTLYVEGDCSSMRIPLQGQASTGLVFALDKDFGSALVSAPKCLDVEVRNLGARDLVITDGVLSNSASDFRLDKSDASNDFPVIIPAGGTHKFLVCYEPMDFGSDRDSLVWVTNIPAPYNESIKTFSILTGRAIGPGLNWDRLKQTFRADSTRTTIELINLFNSGNVDVELVGVSIAGVDASEFSVIGSQAGKVIAPGDTMSVYVAFKLDMTQQPITRIHKALLQTTATLDPTNVKTVELEAGFAFANVAKTDLSKNITIRPNPARDRVTIDVNLERSEAVSIKLFDVLGREMKTASYSGMMPGWNSITLDLQALARGTYIAIITLGEHVETRSLIVE